MMCQKSFFFNYYLFVFFYFLDRKIYKTISPTFPEKKKKIMLCKHEFFFHDKIIFMSDKVNLFET